MKTSRISAETGYVLHTRPYRESSLLLDVFTPHYGRISLVARGARNSQSNKKNNPLQLFTGYHFSWMGKSELYTLTQAEPQGAAHLFSPYQLCCGLYINELLLRVLNREDPHVDLYIAYQKLLSDLIADQNTQISLRIFEYHLLQNMGYGFALEHIEPEEYYLFKPLEGFILIKQKTEKIQHHIFSGESLVALSHQILQEKHLSEIKRLMRLALSPLIGEKPLRSRELFI